MLEVNSIVNNRHFYNTSYKTHTHEKVNGMQESQTAANMCLLKGDTPMQTTIPNLL